ncbi:UDP-3-O-(3-hydroxymyristoyl)glucosamine N-acyltransferase [Dasania sp. GY-MA-18]|uniref:UDP-3-O-acylglucosamine N-acyltransferase n=1 Tax=Dasania phycosphaerae TaxID=2950436 RepID=A0A9J6RPG8_9GAMM|nr:MULTISPECIES: UDP-3-O-(3-hydroxymyristoyl)glucosamine N-acyltransferase [Dasania]MCR8923978.1 UDP-3-O-(3-hydroxymyristoyl)glucosamine N-acyltransferase [Dasania sp. GY-MA-18]MCZ0866412.1 UDP-3-O-(3-hydroxymyristoyl)glucosamine N-acyltransferase [Dasania phycosphaerae]MCZ0870136.1 UDP-3-O-(3-hydroxymyristoyl)glucosamine N-acyltransferase [Dasania phycosphaerae]
MTARDYSLAELAEQLQLECVGDSSLRIVGLATLASAATGQLSFLANPRYQKELANTAASAVIVSPAMLPHCPVAALVSDNPYLSYAQATQLFKKQSEAVAGIADTAVVAASADIASSASIGANCVIGERVRIGEQVVIGPGSVIGDDVVIGPQGLLHANVTLYHGVSIGHSVILHSGVVIGADGFGFAPTQQGWQKIEQLGAVVIGDHVEIGANSCIDRGALNPTIIGNHVIIDNLVQCAHNVQIGDGTAIAGCTAIAGSTRIGSRCTIAGGVGIVGHISLADNVHITAHTLVTKSISQPGSYSSGTPMLETQQWRKAAARFAQLDAWIKKLSRFIKANN